MLNIERDNLKIERKYINIINETYGVILQLTDGETDPELKEYYNNLLDNLQDTVKYIICIENQNARYAIEKAIDIGSI